jgi:ATP-binding cassette subfamily C (CFTR/MRP) protein 1
MINCARKLQRNMMINLLYSSLNEFYDRIPIGRIINRFSKDLVNIDEALGFTLSSFAVCLFSFVGDLSICVYATTPYILIAIFFFGMDAYYV